MQLKMNGLGSFAVDVDEYLSDAVIGSDGFMAMVEKILVDHGFFWSAAVDSCQLSNNSDGWGWAVFCRVVRLGSSGSVFACVSYVFGDKQILLTWTS